MNEEEIIKGAEEYAKKTECKGCPAHSLPDCQLKDKNGSPCDEYERAVKAWLDGQRTGFNQGMTYAAETEYGKKRIETLTKGRTDLIHRNILLEDELKEARGVQELNDRIVAELRRQIKELKAQIEKMKNFIFEEIDFCFYCPLTDTCINNEGTCPYANITEEEQKKLLSKWINK